MQTKFIKMSVLAIAVVLTSGCAADLQRVEEAQATANAALEEAKAATAQVSGVRTIASDAAYAAAKAQDDATAALQCCNDNSSRLDRMFQKAMKK